MKTYLTLLTLLLATPAVAAPECYPPGTGLLEKKLTSRYSEIPLLDAVAAENASVTLHFYGNVVTGTWTFFAAGPSATCIVAFGKGLKIAKTVPTIGKDM